MDEDKTDEIADEIADELLRMTIISNSTTQPNSNSPTRFLSEREDSYTKTVQTQRLSTELYIGNEQNKCE
jgi:hypothetical protein